MNYTEADCRGWNINWNYGYEAFKNCEKEYKVLKKQLIIEAGVLLSLYSENGESGFKLYGLNIDKAQQILTFHPFINYYRRTQINIFPDDWRKITKFWEDSKSSSNVDYWLDLQHKIPANCEITKLDKVEEKDIDLITKISKMFHKTMPEESFKIVEIYRYQDPILYMRFNEKARWEFCFKIWCA